MKKIRHFLEKRHMLIIVTLASMLVVKSCQSCSRKSAQAFETARAELEIDSLRRECKLSEMEMITLEDSISLLNAKLSASNSTIEMLSRDKESYKRMSQDLIEKKKR